MLSPMCKAGTSWLALARGIVSLESTVCFAPYMRYGFRTLTDVAGAEESPAQPLRPAKRGPRYGLGITTLDQHRLCKDDFIRVPTGAKYCHVWNRHYLERRKKPTKHGSRWRPGRSQLLPRSAFFWPFYYQTVRPKESVRGARSYNNKRPFPPRTQGFLYFYRPFGLPWQAGEVRFRMTKGPNPSTFNEGKDLELLSGSPWRVPLFRIASEKRSVLREVLIRDKLVTSGQFKQCIQILNASNFTDMWYEGSPFLWSLNDPFSIDLAHFQLHIYIWQIDEIQLVITRMVSLLVQRDHRWVPLYSGRLVCSFERSQHQKHANTRTLVVRILSITEPIKPLFPDYDCSESLPKQGDLLRRDGDPIAINVDKGDEPLVSNLRLLYDRKYGRAQPQVQQSSKPESSNDGVNVDKDHGLLATTSRSLGDESSNDGVNVDKDHSLLAITSRSPGDESSNDGVIVDKDHSPLATTSRPLGDNANTQVTSQERSSTGSDPVSTTGEPPTQIMRQKRKLPNYSRNIATLDQHRLIEDDFIQIAPGTSFCRIYDRHYLQHAKTSCLRESRESRVPPIAFYYRRKGAGNARFPPGVQGFLYFFRPSHRPIFGGEIRLRITASSSPEGFETGQDLVVDGLPWRVPLYEIALQASPTLRNILVRDKLVTSEDINKCVADFTKRGRRRTMYSGQLMWSLDDPFWVELEHPVVQLCFWDVGHAGLTRDSLPLFKDRGWKTRKRFSPYSGRIICRFEQSAFQQHVNTRTLVVRVISVVQPVQRPASPYDTVWQEPAEGLILCRGGFPLSINVDRDRSVLAANLRFLWDKQDALQASSTVS